MELSLEGGWVVTFRTFTVFNPFKKRSRFFEMKSCLKLGRFAEKFRCKGKFAFRGIHPTVFFLSAIESEYELAFGHLHLKRSNVYACSPRFFRIYRGSCANGHEFVVSKPLTDA